MSFRLWSCACLFGWAAFGWSGPAEHSAQDAEKPDGRAIELSEAGSGDLATNLPRLGVRSDPLKDRQKDSFKPLKPFKLDDSAEGSLVAPVRPPASRHVAETKRDKERREREQDREKNWVFATPEELMAGPTVEEIFNLPQVGEDGLEKKRLSLVEQYYQDPDRGRHGGTNQASLADSRQGSQPMARQQPAKLFGAAPASSDDAKLAGELGRAELSLKQWLGSDSTNAAPALGQSRSTFSDIFGLGGSSPSPEQTSAQRARMDELRQSLGVPSLSPKASGADLLNSLGAPPDSSRRSANPFGGVDGFGGAPRHSAFDGQWGGVRPLPGATSLPDVYGRSFGAPGLQPGTPKIEPVNPVPTGPVIVVPRRTF